MAFESLGSERVLNLRDTLPPIAVVCSAGFTVCEVCGAGVVECWLCRELLDPFVPDPPSRGYGPLRYSSRCLRGRVGLPSYLLYRTENRKMTFSGGVPGKLLKRCKITRIYCQSCRVIFGRSRRTAGGFGHCCWEWTRWPPGITTFILGSDSCLNLGTIGLTWLAATQNLKMDLHLSCWRLLDCGCCRVCAPLTCNNQIRMSNQLAKNPGYVWICSLTTQRIVCPWTSHSLFASTNHLPPRQHPQVRTFDKQFELIEL